MLKITLAQLNPTIGDIEGNLALMRAAARKAECDGAQVVVFPELSLTAYYPYDGASFAVDPQRGVVFEAQRFVEDTTTTHCRSTARLARPSW